MWTPTLLRDPYRRAAPLVEIARALAAGRRCLLLDEPTSALERAEIHRLLDRVRALVANGVAVLYISHHLEEVFDVCDDVPSCVMASL